MKNKFVESVDYIIPFRESNFERKRALQFVVLWLHSFFPELNILIVEQDDNPKLKKTDFPQCEIIFVHNPHLFNKGWAMNVGVQKSKKELLVFGDADIFLPFESYSLGWQALQKWEAVAPKKRVVNVDQVNFSSLTFQEKIGRSSPIAGGICMFRRKSFDFIGGWDENFEGWGYEDIAMSVVIRTFLSHHTLESDAYHIDHQRSILDNSSQPNYSANLYLWQKIASLSKPESLDYIKQNKEFKIGDPNKYSNPESDTLVDSVGRTRIRRPANPPQPKYCIATVVFKGYAHLMDDMLGSLQMNGDCQDALLVVFIVDNDPECCRVAAKYGALQIHCESRVPRSVWVKSILYSVARVVEAQYYLLLDGDMLILKTLRPIFAMLEDSSDDRILACTDTNTCSYKNLEHMLTTVYCGSPGDISWLLGTDDGEGKYGLCVNGGLHAGTHTALLRIDETIRAMAPGAAMWLDERPDVNCRYRFLFNLALARLGCGQELDPVYNIQLNHRTAVRQ